ncbi:GH36-type glycosyl hydrolase domain-containing protein [Cohnella sp. AR92]|uniref:GH36-type glycosyl hydrolase domain-containing protein n=1 Tax=Cohnella sp. AR92 TaxID=648716 RepID=UPI000F8D760F|nr:cellobiose phosphorylase [Cohnella sp. AR92]RUS49000.1 cellobiose phosphorylase [Cohnella sp. AR92]
MTTLTMAPESKLTLRKGDLRFAFLNSGELYEAVGGTTMINQLMSNPLDGALGNLYIRLFLKEGIRSYPLLGIRSASRFGRFGDRLVWKGEIAPVAEMKKAISYEVRFSLAEQGMWFWEVRMSGSEAAADVIYTQDIGLADPGAVRTNEAYVSQYIDHSVYEDDELGFVVCSRQNQPQGGRFPYLQQGSLTKAEGYSTDGFQFFGLSYKETNQPEALQREHLPNEIYQYEFAFTALQSGKASREQESRFVFYGLFRDHHPDAVGSLENKEVVRKAWEELEAASEPSPAEGNAAWEEPIRISSKIGQPLRTLAIGAEELELRYPNRRQEERENGSLLAFFTDSYEHVVLKGKELLVERPHGHILMSGDNARQNPEVVTTTSYMYGIFNSHLVVGNTNLNKMMTNARSALNIPKTAGQRIYVEADGRYRLLTMPSWLEIGFNYVRWFYKTESETWVITNFTTVDSPEVRLHVQSQSGAPYRYLVTNQISMHVVEYEVPFRMELDERTGALTFRPEGSLLSAETYPELAYRMQLDGTTYKLGDERLLADGPVQGSASLVVMELAPSAEWTLTHQGLLNGGKPPVAQRSADAEIERYRTFYAGVMNGFKLSREGRVSDRLFKMNALAWWYTHNMLVHYSVPHGLEQYGGAAWGTRDVCQGPVEYFLATHQYRQIRDVLLTVFSHQYAEDGNWPQWFMFDKYAKIQQEESHGDIIVWPLKVLADYLKATGDFGILEEQVPYTAKEGFGFTESTASVRDHALKELNYIRTHFLHDTHLSAYGDGDWDDTLQPANAQLKKYMVSSWTVALTYQTIHTLSQVLAEQDAVWSAELGQLAEGIKTDFNRHILGTDVIPGFLYFEDPKAAKLMLHPTDEETGIQYRLLPMTRSMIGELLTPEQMQAHYEIIQEKLYCPDGVRLMNRPAQYVGGVSVHFKRAEQASNFGREIGLQYVHAHIRYIEAMAKIGKRDQTWRNLEVINPIGIREVVPNAELRQSNAYFSSSDGKFKTRYEAQERFDELRDGTVAVKGGWRIYSSGPGIYMNQLISNVLGIREEEGDLIVDPVLPAELDGTRFDFEYGGKPISFVYRIKDGIVGSVAIAGKELEAERMSNPYRTGGLRIKRSEIEAHRTEGSTIIEVYA